ncbi:MAG: biotin-dependent carboxyltransferase family protein [Planctomycetota bacterium]
MIHVVGAAGQTTVQDLGRPGHRGRGIVPGGAADPLALVTANLLVGNPAGAAALEMTLLGPALSVDRPTTIAVSGADLGMRVDGRPCPPWRAHDLPADACIEFAGRCSGCRAILAVAGGIDVASVLGSRATDLRAGFGGLGGRALRTGDLLPIGPEPARRPPSGPALAPDLRSHGGGRVRFVAGPEAGWFTAAARDTFATSPYTLTAASDRMGCRLAGAPLPLAAPRDMLSQAVLPGTVQVPPGGLPIVLLADAPVTGGYPRIGVVITVDLPIVAQTMPGETLRFHEVGLDEALALCRERRSALARLGAGLACAETHR